MNSRDAEDALFPADGYPTPANKPEEANGKAADTRAFLMQSFPTLGGRLAVAARQIASRRMPTFLWLQPLETVMEHLASLPVPAQERFQRTEALSHPASFPQQTHTEEASREGQRLPASLQHQLQGFIGRGTEAIRIHDDAKSDAFAQTQRADAVTVGSHIFFRQGRFRPQEDKGFALLTHEALHVVKAMQPGTAWRRATQAGVQEEEQEAATVERRALDVRRNAAWGDRAAPAPSRPLVTAQPGWPSSRPLVTAQSGWPALPPLQVEQTTATVAATAPVQQPMRASTDRTLESSQSMQMTPTMPDMDELKRTIYRDLMRQIKAEMERGG